MSSFRPVLTDADHQALVRAAFACPWCLASPSFVAAVVRSTGAETQCRCSRCTATWHLSLSVEQAHRLLDDPPWSALGAVVHLRRVNDHGAQPE